MSQTQLVTVYRSQGILGAEVVKAKLEAAGIPALLKYESAGLVLGLTVDGLGQVEVQVTADREAEATALIADEAEPTSTEAEEEANPLE